MNTLLALDLGTSTGWALLAGGDTPAGSRVTSGAISFESGRFEGSGMRYLRFQRWLDELHAAVGGIDEVHFKEVRRHAGAAAARDYGGFLAMLMAWCESHGIPYAGATVASIKKHVTDKGNADRTAVVSAVSIWGQGLLRENQAFALALLWMVMCQDNEDNWRTEIRPRSGQTPAVGV
jgi:Holliday junction resolvasome RuvABC endonuclease subunit